MWRGGPSLSSPHHKQKHRRTFANPRTLEEFSLPLPSLALGLVCLILKAAFCFHKVHQTGICSNSSKSSQEKSFRKFRHAWPSGKNSFWRQAWMPGNTTPDGHCWVTSGKRHSLTGPPAPHLGNESEKDEPARASVENQSL